MKVAEVIGNIWLRQNYYCAPTCKVKKKIRTLNILLISALRNKNMPYKILWSFLFSILVSELSFRTQNSANCLNVYFQGYQIILNIIHNIIHKYIYSVCHFCITNYSLLIAIILYQHFLFMVYFLRKLWNLTFTIY